MLNRAKYYRSFVFSNKLSLERKPGIWSLKISRSFMTNFVKLYLTLYRWRQYIAGDDPARRLLEEWQL
jgi:hypothetical protein